MKDKVSGSVENPVGRPLRKHMLPLNYSYSGAYHFLCSSVNEKNLLLIYRNVMVALWGELRIMLEM